MRFFEKETGHVSHDYKNRLTGNGEGKAGLLMYKYPHAVSAQA